MEIQLVNVRSRGIHYWIKLDILLTHDEVLQEGFAVPVERLLPVRFTYYHTALHSDMLTTTSAHTFNLIFPKVGVGVYTLSIEAALKADGTIGSGSGTAIGAAAYGLGSVTVESVRLVHDFSF